MAIKIKPQTMRKIAGKDITSSYQLVDSTFGASVYFLRLVSTLDSQVTISLDGISDWQVLPAGKDADLYFNNCAIDNYLGIYVKGSTVAGNLYVTALVVATK